MSTEAAKTLIRKRWDSTPPDGKPCEKCGKPCRVKYCGNACRVRAYQERKKKRNP